MPEFQNLPPRLAKLPKDHRGFPIPWFVATIPATGERDFRVADYAKRDKAVRHKLCWVCGEACGKYLAFPIGPMCAVTRTTPEPGCHLDCAEASVKICPFLTQPRMRRNYKDIEETGAVAPPGEFLERNPGVTCIWVTTKYKMFSTDRTNKNYLLQIGDPENMLWYCRGRPATRAEVDEAIKSGLPALQDMAWLEGPEAIADLNKRVNDLLKLMDKLWKGN